MITLKRNEFLGSDFDRAMVQLCTAKLPVKAAYSAMKIAREISKAKNTAIQEMKAIQDKFSKKNEDGTPSSSEVPGEIAVSDENQEEFHKAGLAWQATPVVIQEYPILLADLGQSLFSAKDLALLAPILVESHENVVPMQPSA